MVHEGLKRNVVSEDGLSSLSTNSAICSSGVGSRRVELGEQETCLRSASVTNNETWQGKSIGDEILFKISECQQ